jgi:hypothetical protein
MLVVATKTIILDINKNYLTRGVSLRVFFPSYIFMEKVDQGQGINYFYLILYLLTNFGVFRLIN